MKRMLLSALLLIAAHAGAETIAVEDYVAALERMHVDLAAKRFDAAKAEAAAIRGSDVKWTHGTFTSDESLLDAIATSTRDDYRLRERIRIVVAEIRREAGIDTAPVDLAVLQQVANEQKVPDLVSGGEIANPVVSESFIEKIAESIGAVFKWIWEKIEKLIDWFVRSFTSGDEPRTQTPGMDSLTIGVAIAIALLVVVLAVQVLRRSRAEKKEVVESIAPIGSARDEDPLSRGATEWERYAAQLAAAGRHREAIRAWYHAVLVTCYAAGVLHFRKGRTNWEYVATLAPSVPWRPEMIELTRRFEQEWYGHDTSSEEALELCSTRAQAILEALRRRSAA